MASKVEDTKGWWGEHKLQLGETRCWRVGPLKLWILHARHEWRLAFEWSEDEGDEEPDWHIDADCDMPDEASNIERHVLRCTAGPLSLRPMLADRPVITSPRLPLFLPPTESATLYVGSPLWIEVGVGSPPRPLREIPIRRPSDTWFGASTREGEMCYATHTRAALDFEKLPVSTRRAVTPLSIHNKADTPLSVERVKLPVPFLSLFSTPSGMLWTESVSMKREEETEMASFDVHKSPPSQVKQAKLLSRAREEPEKGLLIRAFSSLFGAAEKED